MLRRLAIVALLVMVTSAMVCLLVGQSAPPGAPEQRITKPDSSQDGKKQATPSKPGQNPPNLAAADVEIVPAPCNEACQQGRRNLEIQGKLEWFTGVLAIVGMLQVGTMIWQAILLYQTRTDIHAQAEWMKTQAGLMEGQLAEMKSSGAVAEQSAKAAEVSAIAAMGTSVPWIALVEFSFVVAPGREHPLRFFEHPQVELTLKNFGQSPALLKQYGAVFRWEDAPMAATNYFFDAEAIIDPGGTYPMNEGILDVDNLPPADAIAELVKGVKVLIFSFWVTYGDIFGSPIKRFEFEKHLVEYDPNPKEMMVVDFQNVAWFKYAPDTQKRDEK